MPNYALEQSHPERHHHFRASRSGYVADVDDVVDLPAEPFVEVLGDFFLRIRVVAADEEIVIAGNARRFDHDVAVHSVERLDNAREWKRALNLFAERIGVAKT